MALLIPRTPCSKQTFHNTVSHYFFPYFNNNPLETCSVLFNLFVIGSVIVISKTNSDRLAANHVIAALAVTDILYVLLPAGFALPSYWSSRWYGGRFTCVLYQLCSDWMLMTSQCLIFCLLIDRLLALRRVINFHNQIGNLEHARWAARWAARRAHRRETVKLICYVC